MNPGDIPLNERPQLVEYARVAAILEPTQLVALQWWAKGEGYKRIGIILGLSKSGARSRVDGAVNALDRHYRNQAA